MEANSATSIFALRRGSDMAYLILYVDDIILTASSGDLLRSVVSSLTAEFSMKDLGHLHHFLGTTVSRSSTSYILELLGRAGMTDCKPCSTPIDTNAKLSADGPLVADATDYWALIPYWRNNSTHFPLII